MTLSLCMIVRNEEDVLERCLNSFEDVFDEIIIVDTGSEDNTINIATKYTTHVYNFEWVDDFSLARNYSFSKATCDYIMWLDADDVITKENLNKLKILKQNLNNNVDVVMLKYAIAFDENNNPTFSFYRERILKRKKNFKWEDPVHEVITPSGKIEYSDIEIQHRKIKTNPTNRNLRIYENLIKNKVNLKPRQLFYYARELYYNNKINKSISYFKQFLKTKTGYKENYIEACLNLSKCYQIKNDLPKSKQILFYSFMFDTPRSEILCELGNIYCSESKYNTAIYYYQLALLNHKNLKNGGFVLDDCYKFIPYVQLSVCYYNLNQKDIAKQYHNLAKQLKPNSPTILLNNKIFE